MYELRHELPWGRSGEMSIGYAESHDQTRVGDQRLMFLLAGAQMYGGMEKGIHSPEMDRAFDMYRRSGF